MLTFSPGWGGNTATLDDYIDVRELQRRLKEQVLELASEADENTARPASFVAIDPDGNPILVDQRV